MRTSSTNWKTNMKRLVVKIGSSTLTTGEGRVDYAYLENLADQVRHVRDAGWQVVIVSSGAIACVGCAVGSTA